MKKIFSAIVMIIGAAGFVVGGYQIEKANMGEMKVSEAQERVDHQRRPIFGPVRKEIRAEQHDNAEHRVSQAEQKVVASQVTANWIRASGAAVFLVGLVLFLFSFGRGKRR